jgi:L-ascorbate metabolism protein UlaG (beta-lactamase superfamily)
MKIQKLGQSCLLIEEGNERLIIDPGKYSFAPIAEREPEDVGPVDVMLITHEHQDHFWTEAIKRILEMKVPRIASHTSIQELLLKENISAEVVPEGEKRTFGAFRIQTVAAPHEALPRPVPANIGFLINETLFHPGDSLTFSLQEPCPVLALPVVAPWLTAKWAFETAIKLKPKIVIPIHDAAIKDFSLETLYRMFQEGLAQHGIEFHPLAPGETFEV